MQLGYTVEQGDGFGIYVFNSGILKTPNRGTQTLSLNPQNLNPKPSFSEFADTTTSEPTLESHLSSSAVEFGIIGALIGKIGLVRGTSY